MSVLTPKVGLFLQPCWQATLKFVRYGRRINIQRPRAPHFKKALIIDVCKPFYPDPRKGMSLADLCEKSIEAHPPITVVDNPYERILAKEVVNWFNHSRLIAIYHSNPISGEDRGRATKLFRKNNMSLKQYGKKVVAMALENTKYEAVLSLFTSHNMMVFSMEPQVAKLLKLNKKIPQYILMAGIVDGRFMSKNELVKYSTMPDLQTAQAGLVTVLNSAAVQLTHNLTHHQQTLLGHLQKHVELQQKPPNENENE